MSVLNNEITNVHSAAFLLGAAGLFSRILGILRDRLLAANFGAGRELDLYYAAFQIPDFMSVLLLLGAGSAAILPIFQEYLVSDRRRAHRLISELTSIFLAGAILLAGAAFFLAPFLIRLIVPGFSVEEQVKTVLLTRIMLLSPILLGLSSILASIVEAFQRFWVHAIAPIVYNLGIILGIVILVPLFGLPGLAIGVVIGALFHLVTGFLPAAYLGFKPHLVIAALSNGVKKVFRLSFPRVVSISLSNITLLILIAVGSTLTEGSIAVFQLAQNLYFVPIGVFGVSYSVAIFPRLTRAFLGKDARLFFHELFFGIRSILFWAVPSAVIFIILRAHVVRVALGAGAFSWEDTRLSAAVLAVFSVALAAGSLVPLLMKGFYALENTWRPLFINLFVSAFSVAIAFVCVKLLVSGGVVRSFLTEFLRIKDLPHPEVVGLAIGFSSGLIINTIVLYRMLSSLSRKVFVSGATFPLRPLLEILGSSFLAGGAAYIVRVSFSETLPLITFMQVLLQGVLAGVAGFAVYFGSLILMGNQDVQTLARSFERRLFRIGLLPPSWNGESHVNPNT